MSTTSDTHAVTAPTDSGLVSLVKTGANRQAIAKHLDSLTAGERLANVLAVRGKNLSKLWEAVSGGEPLRLTDLVPEGERDTIIFEGRNSLPAFTRFQKRFARVGDTVVGYNHQVMAAVTGPGYFVVREPTPGEAHPDTLFVDYTTDPPGIPVGWPRFLRNDVGLSRAVYMNMKDFCRRVAEGVLIGKAYKQGVAQGAYFTLTRAY